MDKNFKKKILNEYNSLPDLPYGKTINIIKMGKLYILESEPVKIYTADYKTYKIKPELWNILSYIIDIIYIKSFDEKYEIPCPVYIDKNDKWVNEIIKIMRSKYFLNHNYYINMGFF